MMNQKLLDELPNMYLRVQADAVLVPQKIGTVLAHTWWQANLHQKNETNRMQLQPIL